MENFPTIAGLQSFLKGQRQLHQSIGFVATMGALHNGHLSLLERAKAENDVVVCSIFVNPTQFNDPKDLEKYPRPIEKDIGLLNQSGCDALFLPAVDEMYFDKEEWHLDLNGLDKVLEGASRPGHFAGVTQIVYKLFNAVGPCTAYFGQKDLQQFRIIQYMVEKLNMPQKLVRCPILREPDGLAMSSRNVHLSPSERQQARVLSKTLFWLRDHLTQKNALKEAWDTIVREGVEPDYLALINGHTLQAILYDEISSTRDEVAAVVAARVGQTRLIDNYIVKPTGHTVSIL